MATAVRTKVISGYSGTLVVNEKRQFRAKLITILGSDTTNKKYVITIKDDGINVSQTIESDFFFDGRDVNVLAGRVFSAEAQIEIKLYQEPTTNSNGTLDTIVVSLSLEYLNNVLDDSYDEAKRGIRVIMDGYAEDITYTDTTNDGNGLTVWNDPAPTTVAEAVSRIAEKLYHYTNNKI